jgi:hypothetical protein
VHLPKTLEWGKIRRTNLERAFRSVLEGMTTEDLEAGLAHRGLIHRMLTPTQAKNWTAQMRVLESKLKSEDYLAADREGEAKSYALLQMLGKRKLLAK